MTCPCPFPSGLFVLQHEKIYKRYSVILEDVVKQIKALLQNQLPGKLDQIELERADGVALADIQSFLIQVGSGSSTRRQGSGTVGPLDGRQRYPSVIVLGEATHTTNALSRRRELRHRISVSVTFREVAPDSELPQIRLWRYVEAIERVLASDPTLGGKAVDSEVTDHVYLKGEEEFIRVAVLILEVLEKPSTGSY